MERVTIYDVGVERVRIYDASAILICENLFHVVLNDLRRLCGFAFFGKFIVFC